MKANERQTEDKNSQVLSLLQQVVEKSSRGDYIYRGETEYFKKVSSTLYREYEDEIDSEKFDIEVVQQEILEQVKEYTTFTDETDILMELQHYGGKTNLIDFTTDYLTSLFFACDGSSDKDGRIILLNRNSTQGKVKSPKKNQNNRVISQKSIFVQSPKGYLDESEFVVITISKSLKKSVLEHLSKYNGIATTTIYNDIFGYIQNRTKHKSAHAEFFRGVTCRNKGGYEKAIEHYDNAIEQKSGFVAAYNNRALARSNLGDYEGAIADYDQAIKLDSGYAKAYNNRGIARRELRDYEGAIADYDQAIKLDSVYAKAYNNRGVARYNLGDYKGAIADYDRAVKLDSDYANAYNNRGIAKSELRENYDTSSALSDFQQALILAKQQGNNELLQTVELKIKQTEEKCCCAHGGDKHG